MGDLCSRRADPTLSRPASESAAPSNLAEMAAEGKAAASSVPADERVQRAEKAKTEGNEFFKQNKYAKALAAYTEAIDLCEVEDDDNLDSLDSLDGMETERAQNPNIH